ncbi:uncharacterized protein LOC141599829 [Silene latifolia]|uniref:uncharacterized protein LOC141599829 n=1 Tax=Silene latifolia TaxID=37657 RepID=UPI003D77CABF
MENFLAVKTDLRSGCGGYGLKKPYAAKERHTYCTNESDTILVLGDTLNDKLKVIGEILETSSDSLSDDKSTSAHIPTMDCSTGVANKCLQKSATFPVSVGSGIEQESQLEECKDFSRSLSMPPVRKLVSAIKGGREKEGAQQKKLSVSWSPDVYDPPPTSVSHFPKKDQQSHRKTHKKHGKRKQKGKNTRGGGSGLKEKKHHRKVGGKSDRCLDSCANTEHVLNYDSSLELVDFNDPGVSRPDPGFGSKFLGQASGTIQCVY